MGMSIFARFPFFTRMTYHYLANKDPSKFRVILEDVPDPDVRRFLAEVSMYTHTPSFLWAKYIGTYT